MADTYTNYYNLTKPEVNSSRNTWGAKQNANLDVVDTALKSLADTKVAKLGTIKSVGYVGNVPTMEKADGTQTILMTQTEVNVAIPIGGIILWSGAVNTIPYTYRLCNGQNGTPDLRDRFVLGAGGNNGVGAVGGSTTHSHGGGTANATLNINQIPGHNHGVNDPGHGHGVNQEPHDHYYERRRVDSGLGYRLDGGAQAAAPATEGLRTSGERINLWLSNSGTGISIQNNGGGQGHNHGINSDTHVPPYLALCYIMRVA